MTVTAIVTILVVLFFLLVASYDYYEKKTGVPVFPSMPAVRNKITEILQQDASTRPADRPYRIIDLGSGSGQLTAHIARAMPDSHVLGIELSYIPWLRSVVRQKLFGPANLEFQRLDFWPYDSSTAHAIVTYLPGRIMEQVGQKLRRELKPGTLIIANTFPLRADWQAIDTAMVRVPFKTNIFTYRQGG